MFRNTALIFDVWRGYTAQSRRFDDAVRMGETGAEFRWTVLGVGLGIAEVLFLNRRDNSNLIATNLLIVVHTSFLRRLHRVLHLLLRLLRL